MNDKVKDFLAIVLAVIIGFAAGYYACTRESGPRIQRLTNENRELATNLDTARSTLDRAVARSAVAERGLTEALELIGTIQDRNKRITILIETVRTTITHLRAIVEDGTKVTEELGNSSEN